MKKLVLFSMLILLIMCKSPIKTQIKNNFKGVSNTERNLFLKKKKAAALTKSVLIFTQGFKGEQITAYQNDKKVYSNYPLSNLKTKYADSFSFLNTTNLIIKDNFSNQKIEIESKNAKKHKFIYVMKEYKKGIVKYLVTYSNTLRPL